MEKMMEVRELRGWHADDTDKADDHRLIIYSNNYLWSSALFVICVLFSFYSTKDAAFSQLSRIRYTVPMLSECGFLPESDCFPARRQRYVAEPVQNRSAYGKALFSFLPCGSGISDGWLDKCQNWRRNLLPANVFVLRNTLRSRSRGQL